MTREEKIEYLAKAVMTLSELGYGKTAYVLNEIRLEMKSQLGLPEDLEEAAWNRVTENGRFPISEFEEMRIRDIKFGAEWQQAKMLEGAVEGEVIGYDDGAGKFITVLEDLPDDSPYKVHDKVKLIVIPEEK